MSTPITAAFIGLLLARHASWAEETTGATGAAGAGTSEMPAAGAGVSAADAALETSAATRLTAGASDTDAWHGGDGAIAADFAIEQAALLMPGGLANGLVLGGDGGSIEVALGDLVLSGGMMGAMAGAAAEGEAELAPTEEAPGAGYLADIENALIGTDGDDVLIGTDGNDYISGLDGDDIIYGRAGDDVLHGDGGNDKVYGEDGNDKVYGDDGDDLVDGGKGSDLVDGGTGNDKLIGGPADDWGFDNLYGGFGSDTYVVNHLSDVPDESYVDDNGVDRFTVSADFIKDFSGTKPYFTAADSFDHLPAHLAAGNHVHVSLGIEDVLLAGDWDADIYGGGGDNVLVGNAGANVIKGFGGDDVLDGRAGDNRLEGGVGDDTYLIDAALDGHDTIDDRAGTSTLRFKGADFDDLTIATTDDVLTFELAGTIRARIEGYSADGPLFRIETDDGVFRVPGSNHGPEVAGAMADRTIAEDTTQSFTLPEGLFADIDPGEVLTFQATLADGAPLPDWLHFDGETGRFTAAPGNDDIGTVDVRVTATDSFGATAETTFLVGVTPVNDAPVATLSWLQRTATEDATFTWSLPEGLFTDADAGDVLRIDVDPSSLPDWLTFDAETGRFTGTPGNDDVGSFDVQVAAIDAAGARATATVTFNVDNVNDAPTVGVVPPAEQIQRLVGDGSTYTYQLPASLFDDVDVGDTLRLKAELADGTPLPGWLAFDADTGTFVATPPDLNVNPFNVRIVAEDGAGATAEAVLRFDVSAYNRAPALVADPDLPLVVAEGEPASWALPEGTFTDADGDLLTYSARLTGGGELPDWLTIDAATGELRMTAAPGDAGDYAITIEAKDPSGAAAGFDTVVTVKPNAAPVANGALAKWEVVEDRGGQLFQLPEGFFTDGDAQPLALSATLADGAPLPSWLSFHAESGELQASPLAGDLPPVTVRITATDPFGAHVSALMDVEVRAVNDAPEAGTATAPAGIEGVAYTWQLPSDAFTDEEGDPLTYTAELASGGSLPNWLLLDSASGTFLSSKPDPSDGDGHYLTIEHGADGREIKWANYDVVVEASDGSGSAETVVTFRFKTENQAPVVAETVANQIAHEDQAFAFRLSGDVFDDPDGDALTLSATLADGAPLPDWLRFENGVFSGRPDNGDVGQLNVRVTATDATGASVSTGFAIDVRNVNDAPVAVDAYADAPIVVPEGSRTILDLTPAGHFTDADGDRLTLEVTQADGSALPGWIQFNPLNHALTLDPNLVAADAGGITLHIRARDDFGATSAPTTLDLVVEPLPELLDTPAEVVTAHEDLALVPLTLTGRFSSADGAVLEATTADGSTLPTWLTFDAASGRFTGTPGNADVGAITVRITATDAAGHTDAESFRLIVVDTNDAPVAIGSVPDHAVIEGRAVSIALPGGLFDDVDAGDALALSAPGLPTWLHFDPASATLSGIAPDVAEATDVTITIRATDTDGAFAETAFELRVDTINHAPVVALNPAPTAAIEGSAYRWTMPDNTFADVDGDALSYAAALSDGSALPAWLNFDASTRTFTGTPGDHDPALLRIKLTATDGGGLSASTVVTLRVQNTNDAPEALGSVADQAVTAGVSIAPVDVTDLFTDADLPHGDSLDFEVTLADGTALPAGLSFDGTILSGGPDAAGSYDLRIIARDDAGITAEQAFRIDVAPASAAPDVAIAADGALPAGLLDGKSHVYHEGIFFGDRAYQLQPTVPEAFADDVAGHSVVRLYGNRFEHVELRDELYPGTTHRVVIGNDNDNIILGGDGDNVLAGGGGNDVLSGAGGEDHIYGGDGDDVLAGGSGSDVLEGGAGADRYEIGGLREGDLDTVFDMSGANSVDFDGVASEQLSFGMDGADLLIAVDGESAVRIESFEDGEATFDLLTDDGRVGHDALLAAVEEMRAASAAGETVPLEDVLDGWVPAAADAGPPDPFASAAGEASEPIEIAPPPVPAAVEGSSAALADIGALSHEEAVSGIAGRAAVPEDPTHT